MKKRTGGAKREAKKDFVLRVSPQELRLFKRAAKDSDQGLKDWARGQLKEAAYET
jgi:predicted HicB family RNase H-like nuclease